MKGGFLRCSFAPGVVNNGVPQSFCLGSRFHGCFGFVDAILPLEVRVCVLNAKKMYSTVRAIEVCIVAHTIGTGAEAISTPPLIRMKVAVGLFERHLETNNTLRTCLAYKFHPGRRQSISYPRMVK